MKFIIISLVLVTGFLHSQASCEEAGSSTSTPSTPGKMLDSLRKGAPSNKLQSIEELTKQFFESAAAEKRADEMKEFRAAMDRAKATERSPAPVGLPSEGNWKQIYDSTTSSEWRTYKDEKTGQVVSFNPRTGDVSRNPVSGVYEAYQKEGASSPPNSAPDASNGTPEPTSKAVTAPSKTGFENWVGVYESARERTYYIKPQKWLPRWVRLTVTLDGAFKFEDCYEGGQPELYDTTRPQLKNDVETMPGKTGYWVRTATGLRSVTSNGHSFDYRRVK